MKANNLLRGRKPLWIIALGIIFKHVALDRLANEWIENLGSLFLAIGSEMKDNALKSQKEIAVLKLQTMKIERSGDVNWRVAGDYHCGPKALIKEGRIAVKYTVSVTCAPHLDQRGFLFDQAMVDVWMKRQAELETTLSCEALVISVAEKMLAKMHRDVPHCKVTELVLTLSPAPHQAAVTARFG